MKPSCNVAALIERYFTDRLMRQRNVSDNTIASYRDTFRLLFVFAQARLRKPPSALVLEDLDARFVSAFLDDLEKKRGASTRTRNLRLTAIRSFFRFVSFEEPSRSALVQRVLAIPSKHHDKRQVHFLSRPEIEAIVAVPDRTTWLGRRDHALLLLAAQTGLRLSELIGLDRDAIHLGAGAHVRCVGKGRKERCTPLTTHARGALQEWLKAPAQRGARALFPNMHGGRLSPDSVQALLAKYVRVASENCRSLASKRVSPHVLRHYVEFRTMSRIFVLAQICRRERKYRLDIVRTPAVGPCGAESACDDTPAVCKRRIALNLAVVRRLPVRTVAATNYVASFLGPLHNPIR